tara:strand:+ start:3390 stop:3860 length:471 start_codon:yes stop_codon:yes gene_type:complete
MLDLNETSCGWSRIEETPPGKMGRAVAAGRIKKTKSSARSLDIEKAIEKAQNESKLHLLDIMKCHITLETMIAPCTLSCGCSFEKEAIESHMKMQGPACPICRKPIEAQPAISHVLKNLAKTVMGEELFNPLFQKATAEANLTDAVFTGTCMSYLV